MSQSSEAEANQDGFSLDKHLAALMEEVGQLAASCDPVALFCACTILLAFRPAEWLAEPMHETSPPRVELLAWLLSPYFPGVPATPPDPPTIERVLHLTSDIFFALTTIGPMARWKREKDVDFGTAMFMAETRARIVRGSAFPEQTGEEIAGIQGRFEKQFRSAIGIAPSRATALLWAIVKTEEDALTAAQEGLRTSAEEMRRRWESAKRRLPRERSALESTLLAVARDAKTASMLGYAARLGMVAKSILPVRREAIRLEDGAVSTAEWAGLIELIGLTATRRATMDDPIDVQASPLFVLPDDSVVLVDVSTALDALYAAYERIAESPSTFPTEKYRAWRGKWTQDRVMGHLSHLFPKESLYSQLTYPDPDKPTSVSRAELDAAILWDPFLVLIEVKAHQFRTMEHAGSPGRLYTDLEKNVRSAFEQAARAKRYYEAADEPEFVEADTGRVLRLQKKKIEKVYLTSVSQHLLGEAATHVANIRRIGLFGEHALPFSVSLGDLEVIATHCGSPDVFLHYIERRLEVANSAPATLAGELELFGAYLDDRLQLRGSWSGGAKRPDQIMLAGFSDVFDAYYMYRRGEIDRRPDIKLDVPPVVVELLASLGSQNASRDARWIAFQLLDLPRAVLTQLETAVREMTAAAFQAGTLRTGVLTADEVSVVVVIGPDQPDAQLRDHMMLRCAEEKYRHRAAKGLGFAFRCRETGAPSLILIAATFDDVPWRHDDELEARVERSRPFLPVPGAREPARNAPCPCASGRKYKRCCLPPVDAARAERRSQRTASDDG